MPERSYVGLIGLGVMGENLAINIASHGYSISVYNRTTERTRDFEKRIPQSLNIKATYSVGDFIKSLERPRRVILMVKAGKPVDEVLTLLRPYLDAGDVVFDCGNSFFRDTERRQEELQGLGVIFMGIGVSGGEEGALKGPSIMVGGEESGYEQSRELWESIAAKADGEPCAGYMGRAGAGHFVKMTHNGIEYALLQLIAESYDIMTWGLGLSTAEARDVFAEWLDGELRSYLLEITVDALSYLDEETGKPLVELVLDKAEQKGTGKWTSQTALDLGIPTPSIDAAVVARIISSHKQLREKLSRKTVKPRLNELSYVEKEDLIENLKKAFHLSSILSYAQGLHLIKQASNEYSYGTDLINVVKVWRNGCIIRSNLLERIVKALGDDPSMENILLHREFIEIIAYEEQGLRSLLSVVKRLDTPTPVFDASLNYLIALRRGRLPASLIQALRDRFGSHGYERIDKPGRFHSSWR